MIVSCIVVAVAISLGLSIGAVLWDSAVEVAQRNEHLRIWVRTALLMGAADGLSSRIVSLAEWFANAQQAFRESVRLIALGGMTICAIVWLGLYGLRHAETLAMRLGDIAAMVAGVAAVIAVVVHRISGSSPTRRFRG